MFKFSPGKIVTLASLTALFMLSAAPVAAQTTPLDGKTFIAEAGEKGKAADEKNDVITFKDGKFHSSSCDQYGYGKGDYKSSLQGDAVTFEAETKSEKDGRLVWKGSIRGDLIDGSFTHYRKGGFFNANPAPIEHWFKGKVKS